ncbi:hypothetical protein ZIOFF_027399 [Zingiber officinale]|uniref:V-type proton ATPase subunit a n=1 Tax=Zingiber officinale TaxID=94328 RepID=A0A8J5L969_ZINOF|nr:hypothetical protein ZIOFF_027399 [Zingiber officinale]
MKFFDDLPPMDHFRSEDMSLVQLIMPVESAQLAVSYLGEIGLLQFKDLNEEKSPFQRTFVNQVKRCGEMSRKLRFFADQISKAGVTTYPDSASEEVIDLEQLEIRLSEHEVELLEMNRNSEKLQQTYNELLEFKLVLLKAGRFLGSAQNHAVMAETELIENNYSMKDEDGLSLLEQSIQPEPSNMAGLRFISGIICQSKELAFERMLFRATRGNMFFNQAPAGEQVMDPVSGEMVHKTVFVVFFSGEQAKSKILKICQAFGASCYPVPEENSKQKQLAHEVSLRLSELEATLDAGMRHRNKALASIGSQLWNWTIMVKKEKAVYDTLNMLNFDVTKKCLVGEGWCPTFAKPQIKEALHHATIHSNSQVGIIFHDMDSSESPPTYFRTNRFTNAFQEIVDAYGVARFQESNPAVYSVITFPFLFAVMFGDWGHGLCLLLGSLVLILHEKKLGSQAVPSVIILIIIIGILHSYPSDVHTVGLIKYRDPYPFGVDPKWRGSRSELPFLNSLKMKMSILLGVSQMNLGIILSYFDAKFHANPLDIQYQFIPQMIFLNSLFGYLALLIVIKWCTGSQADLYHVMIYMFLEPFGNLGENQLFWGQKELQVTLCIHLLYREMDVFSMCSTTEILLLVLVVIEVCLILYADIIIDSGDSGSSLDAFSKTIYLEETTDRGRTYGILGTSEMDVDHEPDSARHQHHEDFNFSEVFVHQMIHSIEFVLGAVSNTASYLRLWALSLAHSELSTVFYEKVLLLAWGYDSIVIRITGLVVFAFATAFVLLMMETLSALLHALRLHWVEFMGKFYHGDGYKFRPFSFKLLADEED